MPPDLERVLDVQPPGACPCCGGLLGKELHREVVEVYDFIPARVVVRQIVRPVSRCARCQHIATAPFPAELVPRLRATPRLIAHIIVEKYGRHLPLHRIDQELYRIGARIPETTRDAWLIWAASQLAHLLTALIVLLLGEDVLHTDGTGFPVIRPRTRTHLGQMSVFCNPVAVVYDYTESKHGIHQRVFLGLEDKDGSEPPPDRPRFAGLLVADAASTANRTFLSGQIVECGCNAHARRNFEDAEETERRLAGEALGFWTALYAVEAEAKRRELDAEGRLALRRERSAPVVADLRKWLDRQRARTDLLPKAPLTQALNYLHNHWDALTRFVTDGRIPIDNNLAERMLRAIAVGRRSYLFAGSHAAARRAALFYTFVMTCRLHGVDAEAWLADVLPRIGDTRKSQLAELLPQRWAPRRATSDAA
jgi:transposase